MVKQSEHLALALKLNEAVFALVQKDVEIASLRSQLLVAEKQKIEAEYQAALVAEAPEVEAVPATGPNPPQE